MVGGGGGGGGSGGRSDSTVTACTYSRSITRGSTHVALVVDASGFHVQHQSQLIRVVDEFVAGLKAESDNLDHRFGVDQAEGLVYKAGSEEVGAVQAVDEVVSAPACEEDVPL